MKLGLCVNQGAQTQKGFIFLGEQMSKNINSGNRFNIYQDIQVLKKEKSVLALSQLNLYFIIETCI